MNLEDFNRAVFYYVTYPFVWIYQQLHYLTYMYILPIFTGKPLAEGWNPKIVREQLHGSWDPSIPLEVNYDECMQMAPFELKAIGLEKTPGGHLRRMIHPQMYYANPHKALKWDEESWKKYQVEVDLGKQDYIEKITLDPTKAILYYNEIKYGDKELLAYNIQMQIKFFGYDNIDIIEILLTIIFFLVLTLLYFIFYHLYKLHLKVERAEFILNENGLSMFLTPEEFSANEMHNAWNEGSRISNNFDLGIELNYCWTTGNIIAFEFFLVMLFAYICKIVYGFLYVYVYLFYVVNMELFTYIFIYLFAFLSIFYYFKWKYEIKKCIHKWVEIDYYYSHFLNHYFRTLCWLNIYKFADDAPIAAYVIVYTLTMIWVYFACDSCDYFMGWNQEYRIDIYNNQTTMHMWWPRVLMNQTWHHFIITLVKPWHLRIVYLILFFWLPFLAILLTLMYYQNKIHVYINNKFFFWNSKRYTFDEIEEQWRQDRKYNYVQAENEKNSRGFGLTIL